MAELSQIAPLDPAVVHVPDCDGCGGIYLCPGCQRLCGWCFGCGDDMPDHCDDCWALENGVSDPFPAEAAHA